MNKIVEYKNLDWGRNVFDFRHKRNRVYIGRHILTTCRIKGRKRLLEGTCITIRSKKFGLLNTSMVLRRKVFGVVFFVDFPLYLIGAQNFEVVRFSYSRRIACSRLSYARFMG